MHNIFTTGKDLNSKQVLKLSAAPDMALPDPPSGLVFGLVLSTAKDEHNGRRRVSFAGHTLPVEATVAAACLLQPEAGDLVLLCRTASLGGTTQLDVWWVLSVLQRGQPAALATLAVPEAESVLLQAPKLSLAASGRLHVATGNLAVQALKTSVDSESVQLVMGSGHLVARQLTRMVHAFHSLADTVTERCRTRVAVIDEINSTQAGTELVESKDAMMFKGSQVMVDAQQTVRIDGKHILMG